MRNADKDARRLQDEARVRIKAEEEQARREMKTQVASIAMAAAVKVMGENNTAIQDEKVYRDFLEEMGDNSETAAY